MSVMERTTYRRSPGSNALAFDETRRDPARISDPVTLASVNASAPRLGTPSRVDIVSAYHTALQSQTPAARTGNEAAAPSKTLDAETLAALMTRAKSLLALGDIAAARLLLERAANAQDASAAFLLAQIYDPAVLGVRDTTDPVMARDWYRRPPTLARRTRNSVSLNFRTNLDTSGGCRASVP